MILLTFNFKGMTVGPRQTEYINQMILLTDTHFGLLTVLIPNRPWINLKKLIPLTK